MPITKSADRMLLWTGAAFYAASAAMNLFFYSTGNYEFVPLFLLAVGLLFLQGKRYVWKGLIGLLVFRLLFIVWPIVLNQKQMGITIILCGSSYAALIVSVLMAERGNQSVRFIWFFPSLYWMIGLIGLYISFRHHDFSLFPQLIWKGILCRLAEAVALFSLGQWVKEA